MLDQRQTAVIPQSTHSNNVLMNDIEERTSGQPIGRLV